MLPWEGVSKPDVNSFPAKVTERSFTIKFYVFFKHAYQSLYLFKTSTIYHLFHCIIYSKMHFSFMGKTSLSTAADLLSSVSWLLLCYCLPHGYLPSHSPTIFFRRLNRGTLALREPQKCKVFLHFQSWVRKKASNSASLTSAPWCKRPDKKRRRAVKSTNMSCLYPLSLSLFLGKIMITW